jgi:hypothetical protein
MRKNKNIIILIIFLVFVILFFDIKETYAFSLKSLFLKVALPLADLFTEGVALFLKGIAYLLHYLLFILNNYIGAPIVDSLYNLNPFYETSTPTTGSSTSSPAKVLWSILRNFSYIILVFAALLAGFQWLLGEDRAAQSLIFKIIIVSFLINFTFTFVKEGFLLIYKIERGLTGNIEGGGLGTLIAGSLWQTDPFNEIKTVVGESLGNNKKDEISRNLAETIGYLSIVFFDMIIFIILTMTAVLLLARFVMIVFLAATSSFAVTSLAFPKFERGVLSQLTSKLGFFESWLNKLVSWLIIIPIFSILVILGNILKENVLAQSQVTGFFEFALILVVLAGWYAISIKVAKNLSGKIGQIAQNLAIGILSGLGSLALFSIKPLYGEALNKVGSLVSKLPVNRFTAPIVKQIGALRKKGAEITEKAYKNVSDVARMKMSVLIDKYKKTKNPKTLKKINKLLKKGKDNPYIAGSMLESLSQADSETINTLFKESSFSNNFSEIIHNFSELKMIERKDLLEKVKQSMDKIFSKQKIDVAASNILNEQLINAINNADKSIQDVFYSSIENLDNNKLFSELKDKIDFDLLNRPEYERLKKTLNKKFNGLIEALISKDVQKIAVSLQENLNLIKDISSFKEFAKKAKINEDDINEAIKTTYVINPENVSNQILLSNKENIENFVNIIRDRLSAETGRTITTYSDIADILKLSDNSRRALKVITEIAGLPQGNILIIKGI